MCRVFDSRQGYHFVDTSNASIRSRRLCALTKVWSRFTTVRIRREYSTPNTLNLLFRPSMVTPMNSNSRTNIGRKPAIDRIAESLFVITRQIEGGVIAFRLIATLPLMMLMFASRERLPYWEFAIAAIATMFIDNLWLRTTNNRKRIPLLRLALIGSAIDTALLLTVSFLAIRASANINSTSEMWLIFPLVILTFVYRTKPFVGIAYAVLLTAWYSANIIGFFDPSDRAVTELPIRATFFVLIGGLAAILGNSLRQ